MTAQQIENGLGLRKALAIECRKLIETTKKASTYCYAMEREYKMLSPAGYAGFQRIYTIWTRGSDAVPPIFTGDIILTEIWQEEPLWQSGFIIPLIRRASCLSCPHTWKPIFSLKR